MFLFLLVLLAPVSVSGQKTDTSKFSPSSFLWLEPQVSTTPDYNHREAIITLSYGHQFKRGLGIMASLAHSRTTDQPHWTEGVVAWSIEPVNGLDLSVGPGFEVNQGGRPQLRGRMNMNMESDQYHHFLYTQLDLGKGDKWYWIDGAYFIGSQIGVGVLVQMPDLGYGPKIEIRSNDKFSWWIADTFEPQKKLWYASFGLRIK